MSDSFRYNVVALLTTASFVRKTSAYASKQRSRRHCHTSLARVSQLLSQMPARGPATSKISLTVEAISGFRQLPTLFEAARTGRRSRLTLVTGLCLYFGVQRVQQRCLPHVNALTDNHVEDSRKCSRNRNPPSHRRCYRSASLNRPFQRSHHGMHQVRDCNCSSVQPAMIQHRDSILLLHLDH